MSCTSSEAVGSEVLPVLPLVISIHRRDSSNGASNVEATASLLEDFAPEQTTSADQYSSMGSRATQPKLFISNSKNVVVGNQLTLEEFTVCLFCLFGDIDITW